MDLPRIAPHTPPIKPSLRRRADGLRQEDPPGGRKRHAAQPPPAEEDAAEPGDPPRRLDLARQAYANGQPTKLDISL